MCGIAGEVALPGQQVDRAAVAAMCAAQIHRGPDSDGFHIENEAVLGARRLAIIDVAHGDQPVYSEDHSIAVVMNGEIYNFAELRSQLERRGHVFRTRSDTEVIPHLYEERGPALVQDLRGMFAFALWDKRAKKLLLARDRVGKKPLYYRDTGHRLSFASELTALLAGSQVPRTVNPGAVDLFLALGYVPQPLSAIDSVRKLPPASFLIWEGGRTTIERYWELEFEPKQAGTQEEIDERIRAHLRDAVKVRLMSERPLGAFLSGGVDSGAVVATMAELSHHPVKTFTIGFTSERFNELPHARRVAELYGTDHSEFIVEPEALAVLPNLIQHYGDPFADPSAIPSFYVAQIASREVTVALNGDGGDESFGGYNRYVAHMLTDKLGRLPRTLRATGGVIASLLPEPRRLTESGYARARRMLFALALPSDRRYAMRMLRFSQALRKDLYQPDFARQIDESSAEEFYNQPWRASHACTTLDRIIDVETRTNLPDDLLVKIDIATMANSLEARSPFLDHQLMEMAARLPVTAKVDGTTKKAALKSAMRGRLPDDLLDRPKWGFSVPLADWLRGPLRGMLRDVLLDPRLRARGQLRSAPIESLISEHVEGHIDRAFELWHLVILELWQRHFIDGEPVGTLLSA